ncbi:MAG TPA: polysaccharide biosynthesis/export family protein [Steroidobacteraceae bacterium]|nr:polysaccharide biosynthesis/export family protein [Steroidobacteraceae bacterium]
MQKVTGLYFRRLFRFAPGMVAIVAVLSGCVSNPGWLAASGPTRAKVSSGVSNIQASIQVVTISDAVARRVVDAGDHDQFSTAFGDKAPVGFIVGAGDVLEVSVWEAPPAVLFGTLAIDAGGTLGTSRQTTIPEQMVAQDGTISVPFCGSVPVAGRSSQQIQADIVTCLQGKANQPQVLVRVTHNATSNVTVVGEVGQSLRMPLTAKGERVLDALAAAGGTRNPVDKTSIQLTRGGDVLGMPLARVIRDPKQNVVLQPGDVMTALFQSNSFTALGASGRNDEINFEAQGISLAQAMGRMGGLVDTRADARGVFIFRFENPAALPDGGKGLPRTPEGRVPVVYQADLKDPATFLVAQDFPVRDKDVIYVANAGAADLFKFLNVLTSSVYTIAVFKNLQF